MLLIACDCLESIIYHDSCGALRGRPQKYLGILKDTLRSGRQNAAHKRVI